MLRKLQGLNPCFNGLCSSGQWLWLHLRQRFSLNPCFNGLCSSGKVANVVMSKSVKSQSLF